MHQITEKWGDGNLPIEKGLADHYLSLDSWTEQVDKNNNKIVLD